MATRLTLHRLIPLLALIVFSAFAVGCAGENPSSTAVVRRLTGEVSGTDAQVAVVASSDHARFYFCGGSASYLTLTRWFPMDVGTASDVSATSGGWQLHAMLNADTAQGTIAEPGGSPHAFTATAVAPGTIGGLYEATSPCGKVGLIVSQASPSAAATGQGACIDANTEAPGIHQVNPILPLARDVDGTIRVTVDGSSEEASVRAATP